MFGRSGRARGGGDAVREVDFSGQFEHSQLVVGEHNTVHLYEGTVVQQLAPNELPTPEARARPQLRLPKTRPEPLGRDADFRVAEEILAGGAPAEFYGPPGIGKSSVVGHMASALGASWADGVIHNNIAGKPLEDVVQWLFDVFWQTSRPWAPGRLRAGEYLRELRMLVVLDDVGFSTDETAALLEMLGRATFMLAGAEPHLDATADGSVALGGVPRPTAVAVFEKCLRRPLDQAEAADVAQLVGSLDGVPGLVLDAARLVRDGVCGVSELASEPKAELDRRRVRALTDGQRDLLSLLVEVAPAAVPVEMLQSAVGVLASDAEALESAGFAESRSPRYALARALAVEAVEELPRLQPARLLEVLTDAAGKGQLGADAGPITAAALQWGSRAGELDAVIDAARAVDGSLLAALRTGAWGAVLELGAAAAHDRGRTADESYFLHQQGTRWLLLGEPERGEEQLRRALAVRREQGETVGFAATLHNLDVLRGEDHAWRRARGAVGAAAVGRRPAWLAHGLGRGLFGAVCVGLGVALGLLVGKGGSSSNLAATHVLVRGAASVRTVVLPERVVTRTGRVVTQTRQTAPPATRITTVTVSAPAGTVTRTVAGGDVTVTTTAPAAIRTITSTLTRTVTDIRKIPTTVCIDCKP